ncbi:uncharacterized protein LOC111602166 [Drosophila hydei]|uniref:Uncharacterized protein LOC111602166 n=1 Tax=Drosophila hydei TaxID=7224 RepID=A0A6J1M8T5_DROHY|nr:uncharacterized protein LOC111602166 [Drosophila hydei]
MTVVQQVHIHCECHHRRGLLYVVRPWAWGRPCRRCRRSMARNLVVVPAAGPPAVTLNGSMRRACATPVVVTTTNQAVTVPQQQQQVTVTPAQTALDWQSSQEAFPSVLPPKYNNCVAVN